MDNVQRSNLITMQLFFPKNFVMYHTHRQHFQKARYDTPIKRDYATIQPSAACRVYKKPSLKLWTRELQVDFFTSTALLPGPASLHIFSFASTAVSSYVITPGSYLTSTRPHKAVFSPFVYSFLTTLWWSLLTAYCLYLLVICDWILIPTRSSSPVKPIDWNYW
jgi:hypothetical protein